MLADAAACARALIPTRTLAHAHVGTRGLPDMVPLVGASRRRARPTAFGFLLALLLQCKATSGSLTAAAPSTSSPTSASSTRSPTRRPSPPCVSPISSIYVSLPSAISPSVSTPSARRSLMAYDEPSPCSCRSASPTCSSCPASPRGSSRAAPGSSAVVLARLLTTSARSPCRPVSSSPSRSTACTTPLRRCRLATTRCRPLSHSTMARPTCGTRASRTSGSSASSCHSRMRASRTMVLVTSRTRASAASLPAAAARTRPRRVRAPGYTSTPASASTRTLPARSPARITASRTPSASSTVSRTTTRSTSCAARPIRTNVLNAVKIFVRDHAHMMTDTLKPGVPDVWHCDNEFVFLDEAVDIYAANVGIHRTFSVKEVHETNPAAERCWGVLLRSARAMIAHAGGDEQQVRFWSYLFSSLQNVYNNYYSHADPTPSIPIVSMSKGSPSCRCRCPSSRSCSATATARSTSVRS